MKCVGGARWVVVTHGLYMLMRASSEEFSSHDPLLHPSISLGYVSVTYATELTRLQPDIEKTDNIHFIWGHLSSSGGHPTVVDG